MKGLQGHRIDKSIHLHRKEPADKAQKGGGNLARKAIHGSRKVKNGGDL